jgi:hypothetical protein
MFDISTSIFEICSATYGGNVYLSGYEFNLIVTKHKFEGIDVSVNDNDLYYGRDEITWREESLIPFITEDRVIHISSSGTIKFCICKYSIMCTIFILEFILQFFFIFFDILFLFFFNIIFQDLWRMVL